MTTAPSPKAELDRLIDDYRGSRARWATMYYGTKVSIIVLGAAIPVLTTLNASPWIVAVAGALIVAIEGMSQLWNFHERYVASRVLFKSLEQERMLFAAGAGAYGKFDDPKRERALADQLVKLLQKYDTHVLSVLEAQEEGAHQKP